MNLYPRYISIEGAADIHPRQVNVNDRRNWVSREGWLFDVSNNPAARWVQSSYLCPRDDDGSTYCVLNGRDSCWRCASYRAIALLTVTSPADKSERVIVLP